MANTVQITPILKGSRKLVYHVYLKSDGAEGELVNKTLLDPQDLGLRKIPNFTLERVTFAFAGFDANIGFESGLVDPTFIWVLPEGSDSSIDFDKFGGLKDRSSTLDGRGKLLINTVGFTSSTDQGSLILELRVS